MNVIEIRDFLGWCTVINLSIYLLSACFMIVFRNFTTNLHSKLMGIDVTELPSLYFKYMGNYKIMIIVFNLVPYIALTVMA
jgi:hypothetical protein